MDHNAVRTNAVSPDNHIETANSAAGSLRVSPKILAICSFLLAFLVYLRTLAPTVYTFDSAEFVTGAYSLGIVHSTGYPFYLLLSKLFTFLPVGDVAYRVNLESALWGAATVAVLSLVCFRLTGRAWIAGGAALLLAFSHYYWPEAVIAETYTLNTLLISLLVLLLLQLNESPRQGTAAVAGLTLGLALANHMSSILTFPGLAFWGGVNLYRKRISLKHVILFGVCALVGPLFYLYLPIRYAADPPLNYAKTYFDLNLTTTRGIWSWVTGEMFRAYMGGYDWSSIWPEIGSYLLWLWTNFLGAGVFMGIVGAVAMFRRERFRFFFLALLYLAYTGFFIDYRVVNKDTMFSVSYLIWTIWIAYGTLRIAGWLIPSHDFSSEISTFPLRTFAAPAVLGALAVLSLILNYTWADQSQNRTASDFANQLLTQVEPGAFVVTEWTWATPLEYLQIVKGRRPDVTVFDRGLYGLAEWNRLRQEHVPDLLAFDRVEQQLAARIQKASSDRPVYATEYDSQLSPPFLFIPTGRYYKLEPLR